MVFKYGSVDAAMLMEVRTMIFSPMFQCTIVAYIAVGAFSHAIDERDEYNLLIACESTKGTNYFEGVFYDASHVYTYYVSIRVCIELRHSNSCLFARPLSLLNNEWFFRSFCFA